MPDEPAIGVSDIVVAELVECQHDPAPITDVPLPAAPDTTPTLRKAQATIEQTGADPPPAGNR